MEDRVALSAMALAIHDVPAAHVRQSPSNPIILNLDPQATGIQITSASSRVRCSGPGARAMAFQRRLAARSRVWATRRDRTVTPGSKTLRSTSRAVARSKSRLGRSALNQDFP